MRLANAGGLVRLFAGRFQFSKLVHSTQHVVEIVRSFLGGDEPTRWTHGQDFNERKSLAVDLGLKCLLENPFRPRDFRSVIDPASRDVGG